MKAINYTMSDFKEDVHSFVLAHGDAIKEETHTLVAVPRGGVPFAMELSTLLDLPLITPAMFRNLSETEQLGCALVDDVVDSGSTIRSLPKAGMILALHARRTTVETLADEGHQLYWCQPLDGYVNYWYEKEDNADVEEHLTRCLEFIGEDPTREGLLETPKRIKKAWGKLFEGYQMDPKSVLKTFAEDTCDEMVLLKDIEFYSMCEHHMLPFHGRAHIAYIPDGKVIGISKLARLLDIFARRMQIQERIGQQITSILMDELGAKGAAVVIEAQHMCMTSRGVEKQNSMMVTSSLEGVFRTNGMARSEFMGLIGK